MLKYLVKKGIIKEKNGNYTLPKVKTTGRCKNLPEKYVNISAREAMKLFFGDIEVSFTTGDLQYDLRSITKESLKIFTTILRNNEIDFSILVAKTRSYYGAKKTVKPKLSNFFIEGTWENVYEAYEATPSELENNTWL